MPGDDSSLLFKRFTKGTNGILGLKIMSTGFNFLVTVLLARLLDIHEYGQYVLAMTVIGVLAVPTTLGLPNLLVRFTAQYQSKERWALLKGLFVFSHISVLSLAAILCVFGYFFSDLYKNTFNLNTSEAFIIGLVLLPLLSVIAIQGAAMRGLSLVVRGQFSSTFLRSLLLLIGVASLHYFSISQDVATVMWVQIFAASIALVFSIYLLLKSVPSNIYAVEPEFRMKKWLRTAFPLLLLGGVQLINQQTDILMIGYYMDVKSVGIYQIAIRVSELAVFLLMAANLAISPTLSKLFHDGDMAKLQVLMTSSARYISIFTIPVVILLYFTGSSLISMVFGMDYSGAYEPLLMLLLGQCINVMVGSVSVLLIMAGYEGMATRGLIISAFINVILNVLLIPQYGIYGAAIATTVSMVIWNALLFTYCLKKLSINCSVIKFSKDKVS